MLEAAEAVQHDGVRAGVPRQLLGSCPVVRREREQLPLLSHPLQLQRVASLCARSNLT